MLTWLTYIDPQKAIEALGLIPSFLDENDSRSASQQIAKNYIGGWLPMAGFNLGEGMRLLYPDDPPLDPIATVRLRDELITVYPYGWVAICQCNDGSFEVSRCD